MARTKTAILIGQSRDLPEPRPERGQEFTLDPSSWDDKQRALDEIANGLGPAGGNGQKNREQDRER